MALSSSRALPSHSLLPFCFSIPRFSLSHQYGGGGRQRTRPHGMLSGCCQSLGFQTTVEPVIIIYRIVAKGLLCIHFGNMLYGGKAERPICFFCLLVLWGIFFSSFSFHSESKQWESLTSECRVLLIESLATMETDSRPELQEKASLLKKTLENLE